MPSESREGGQWTQTNEAHGCASSIRNARIRLSCHVGSFLTTARSYFLLEYVGKFDMYVEDDYAAFVRYCFADPLDAEIFRTRFESKVERFKLAG
jgi:hypothetical protein